MMPALSIEHLGKKYQRNTTRTYVALRDVLAEKARSLFRHKPGRQEFWALQDINIEVACGERIGIIGHNGAGKSTLLKVISRITPPSSGKVVLHGRVASLLEVGTGFHPELTGRENIYLNGAILGLRRDEIQEKLDQIVDFSGIAAFIDSPLKHYSTGMQLRLAFSVAAHLEPEILLIDEVLAVGDIEFQKKCIGKMQDVSLQSGRTILFVSHNMAAVKQLCTKGLVIGEGRQLFYGPVAEAIDVYSRENEKHLHDDSSAVVDLSKHPNKKNQEEGLKEARVFINGSPSIQFIPGGELKVELSYYLKTKLINPNIGIVIKDENNTSIIGLNSLHLGKKLNLRLQTASVATVLIPKLNLYKPGRYSANLYFGDAYHFYETLYDAISFEVLPTDIYGSGVLPDPAWNLMFFPGMDIYNNT
jgi:lipopolysaccharide transport system ATP-binding protein